MMGISGIWVYLNTSPLFWLTLTVFTYLFSMQLADWCGGRPIVNSVLVSASVVVLVLWATSTPYPRYFEGAQFVHFLLGPATVALAVPLYKYRREIRSAAAPMACALVAGSLTAIGSAVGIAIAFGAPNEIVWSVAPKSTSAPIAMELAKGLGGVPSLAAVLVILTGITGAVIVTPLMNALRIRNFAARGFAVGVASHGIGTARAFQVSDVAGSFAGIAMALNGALTSILAVVWLLLSHA